MVEAYYNSAEEVIAYGAPASEYETAEDFYNAAAKQGNDEFGGDWGNELGLSGEPRIMWLDESEADEQSDVGGVLGKTEIPGATKMWVISVK